jgi:mono/diheme cytochrome c family protein
MKSFFLTAGIILSILYTGCRGKEDTGRVYMPDMAYSRALETYSSAANLKDSNIYYTGLPVTGTIARGDSAPYTLLNNDSGYAQSKAVLNPIKEMNADQMKEAERLFLVNCAICHGAKLDGNGPLWKDNTGPFPAAPKNLMASDAKLLAPGTIFHVATFGKNMMGSYASQLNTNQRWMVVSYIKFKQGGGGSAGGAATDSTGSAKKDSTAVK